MAHAFFLAEPSALSYGMSDDDFWYGRPWLFAAYREKARRESDERAWERWQQGAYAYDAIQRNAPLLNALARRHTPEQWPDVPYGMETPAKASPIVDSSGRPVAHDSADVARTHALIIDNILSQNRR